MDRYWRWRRTGFRQSLVVLRPKVCPCVHHLCVRPLRVPVSGDEWPRESTRPARVPANAICVRVYLRPACLREPAHVSGGWRRRYADAVPQGLCWRMATCPLTHTPPLPTPTPSPRYRRSHISGHGRPRLDVLHAFVVREREWGAEAVLSPRENSAAASPTPYAAHCHPSRRVSAHVAGRMCLAGGSTCGAPFATRSPRQWSRAGAARRAARVSAARVTRHECWGGTDDDMHDVLMNGISQGTPPPLPPLRPPPQQSRLPPTSATCPRRRGQTWCVRASSRTPRSPVPAPPHSAQRMRPTSWQRPAGCEARSLPFHAKKNRPLHRYFCLQVSATSVDDAFWSRNGATVTK